VKSNHPGENNKPDILIVDDNRAFCDTLKSLLEAHFYSVTGVYSAKEAVAEFKKNRQRIVLLDMKLEPGISGADVYFIIKSLEPDTRVILITAYRQEMDPIIEEALRKGAQACLNKPFGPDELIQTMQEIYEE
jgi:CheY-like chemotaxis protein